MGNGISEGLKINIFLGSMPPDRIEKCLSPLKEAGTHSCLFFLREFSREYVLFDPLTIRIRTCRDSRHDPKYMHAPSVTSITIFFFIPLLDFLPVLKEKGTHITQESLLQAILVVS